MIASLQGKIQRTEADFVVLEVGGVGLQVHLPAPIREQLRPGDRAELHTVLVVREDSLTLYGFETIDARNLFSLLMSVSGVGPRLALAILSTLEPDAIRRAIFHEQPEIFSRVPGVGKKTAQKIQFHLQDRLPAEAGLERLGAYQDVDSDVLEALTALGYSVVEAQAALQTLPREAPDDIESRLRLALQYFSR